MSPSSNKMQSKLFYDRLLHHLTVIYGETRAPALVQRLLDLLGRHVDNRPAEPQARPLWDETDNLLITYGNSVQYPGMPPLASLKQFCDRYLQGTFSRIHLLPFFPFSSDEGFAITDFHSVNPDLGDWEDVRRLGEHFSLMFDLVLNHMSREHLWFVQFVHCEKPGVDYVVEVDPQENLSMVVRPRSTPLLSRVRTPCGIHHVWATFSNDQIDLNYANPDVLLEIIDLLLTYISRGAEGIRLDAVAYIWKQIGTTCVHLPQTHEIVKLFRTLLSKLEPNVLLLTETNVPHQENISYFDAGEETNMVYQFALPPLLLQAIQGETTKYLTPWAQSLEQDELPPGCTYLNFTASHDGVGLRPLEGVIPEVEVDELIDAMRRRGAFVSMRATSDGSDRPYELNISYFDAFRTPDDEIDPWHAPRFMLSQILPLCLRGIPAVYINALTATPNDILGVERTNITRNINRRKWDGAELEALIDSPMEETGQVFPEYVRCLQVRRTIKAFHPDAPQHVMNLPDGLFGVLRTSLDGEQRVFALHNLTSNPKYIKLDGMCGRSCHRVELLHEEPPDIEEGTLTLLPFQVVWLTDAQEPPAD